MIRVGLASALLLALVAGCGGEGEPTPTPTARPVTASAQPTGTVQSAVTAPPATTQPASLPGVDPCSLVARNEAAEALGTPVGPPVRQANLPVEGPRNEVMLLTQCLYPDPVTAAPALVLQLVQPDPSRPPFPNWRPADYYEQARRNVLALDGTPQPVEGLGEQAFWSVNPAGLRLVVLTADTALVVTLPQGTGAQAGVAERIARAALGS